MDNEIKRNDLKKLYNKRWEIEEYFKLTKYALSMKDFHSKSENLIKQELSAHKCIYLITIIYNKIYETNNKIKLIDKKNNLKNDMDKTINKTLLYAIYGESNNIDDIIHILKTLFNYLTSIIPNRNYKRITIIPPTKWHRNKDKGIT